MRLTASLLLVAISAAAAADEGEYQYQRRKYHRRGMEVERIVVPANDAAASIATAATAADSIGAGVEIDNLNMGDGNIREVTRLRPMHVWGDGCTVEDEDGNEEPCDNGNVILVSDEDEPDLIVLTSNPTTGETSGFVSSDGTTTGVAQMNGGRAKGEPPVGEFIPPNWSCHMDAPPENRRLLGEGLPGHDHHDHDAHDHDHFNLDNLNEAFEKEGIRLRGSSTEDRPGRKLLYFTDTFPQSYSYQVDIFIEYDQQLVNNNGGTAGALQYIADLMAGANIIYEKEIDTHLSVSGLLLTSRYDSSSNTSGALSVLRNARMGSNFPSGANLVHALLGRSLGGGIAYLNAVCSTNIGFGVSAGIVGAYNIATPAAMVWDIVVFTHELGHNFGTGHTHNYSPVVDSCGSGQCGGLPNNDAATIMSYCHLCSGGLNNVAPSFGGHREVQGGGSNPTGVWIDDPLVASKGFSVDPKRVAQTMKNFIAGRGSCVAPDGTPPNQQAECTTAGDCDDGNTCTVDTCDTSDSTVGGVCVHVDTCPSEAPSAAPTCGGDKIVVNIDTDNYPGETTWTLENTCSGGGTVMTGGPYGSAGTLYSSESCADPAKYKFTLQDAWGDGICCGYGQGSYEITMGGNVVASGGQFGSQEIKEFGTCQTVTGAPTTPAPTVSSAPSAAPTASPSASPSASPTASPSASPSDSPSDVPTLISEAPSSAPSKVPTATPTKAPVIGLSEAPSSGPTPSPVAACTNVKVNILTDNYPGETTWDVKDADGAVVMSGGPYRWWQRRRNYSETACLDARPHTFLIKDSWGDGICCRYGRGAWTVSLADSGVVLGSGGDFRREESFTFTTAEPENVFQLDLKTDRYPWETRWQIASAVSGTVLERGGPYYRRSTRYSITESLPANDCFKFYIYDSWGDGICCSYGRGDATIKFDGTTVGSAGAFGRQWVSDKFGDATACAGVNYVVPPEALEGEPTNMTAKEKQEESDQMEAEEMAHQNLKDAEGFVTAEGGEEETSDMGDSCEAEGSRCGRSVECCSGDCGGDGICK